MGIMTAYSSHNLANRKTLVMDEKLIAFGDTAIAFIGGLTIYSFLGHQCHKNDKTGDSCDLYTSGGMGLAFGVYPEVIMNLGGSTVDDMNGSSQAMLIVFFLCL